MIKVGTFSPMEFLIAKHSEEILVAISFGLFSSKYPTSYFKIASKYFSLKIIDSLSPTVNQASIYK